MSTEMMPTILSSIITLMWSDLLIILVIVVCLSVPFFAVSALLNQVFRRRKPKIPSSPEEKKEEGR